MGCDQEAGALRPQAKATLDLAFQDLSEENAAGLFDFFAGPAFTAYPQWRKCNCFFYNHAGDDWDQRTAEQNRADKLDLIRSGRTHGVIAYSGGEVAGWCHADRRSALVRLDTWATHPSPETTGCVVCFVVNPALRRRGVAGRLLGEATSMLERMGLEAVEAYPPVGDPPAGLPVEQAIYHGTPSMYAAAGFAAIEEHGPVLVVRKQLG